MLLNGAFALAELDDFESRRRERDMPFTREEARTLDAVRRDAVQASIKQRDDDIFGEFERRRQVELEYLYQVRGIRQARASAVFREGYAGYGNGWTGSKIRLLYPLDRKRAGREAREMLLPINKVRATSALTEQLVPLRINLTTDKHRLKDRIMWNADDTTVPLELFVENVLDDYGIPVAMTPHVVQSLHEQIASHMPHIYPTPAKEAERAIKQEPRDEKLEKPESPFADADEGAPVSISLLPTSVDRYDPVTVEPEAPRTGEMPPETVVPAVPVPVASAALVAPAPATSVPAREEPSEQAATPSIAPVTAATDASAGSSTGTTAAAAADVPAGAPKDETDKAPSSAADIAPPDGPTGAQTGAEADAVAPVPGPASAPSLAELVAQSQYDEDMRITIKLNLTIGHHQLLDQFEWDINNPQNDPEMFGVVLANELALPMEFGPAVAHTIREQCQAFTKSLFRSGYQFDGKPPYDQALQNELSPPVSASTFLRRPDMLAKYSPALEEAKISRLTIHTHEQDQERRELRSRRRQGRTSRRNMTVDARNAAAAAPSDAVFFPHEIKGPDFCTPVYSNLLPGGLDRNLDILHMTLYHADDGYGGDRPDLVYNFHKLRRERGVPSASLFDRSLVPKDRASWIVKLKLPQGHDILARHS